MNKITYLLVISFLSFPIFSADDDEDRGGIEEVIVTAEKEQLQFKTRHFR